MSTDTREQMAGRYTFSDPWHLYQNQCQREELYEERPQTVAEKADWFFRLANNWSRYAIYHGEGYGSACAAYTQAANLFASIGDVERADQANFHAGVSARLLARSQGYNAESD